MLTIEAERHDLDMTPRLTRLVMIVLLGPGGPRTNRRRDAGGVMFQVVDSDSDMCSIGLAAGGWCLLIIECKRLQ